MVVGFERLKKLDLDLWTWDRWNKALEGCMYVVIHAMRDHVIDSLIAAED